MGMNSASFKKAMVVNAPSAALMLCRAFAHSPALRHKNAQLSVSSSTNDIKKAGLLSSCFMLFFT